MKSRGLTGVKIKGKKKKEGEEQLLFLKTVRKEDWRGGGFY